MTRWRPPLGPVGIGTVIAARDGRLRITLYTGPRPPGQRIDARVMVNAGPGPAADRAGRTSPGAAPGRRRPDHRAGRDPGAVPGGRRRCRCCPGSARPACWSTWSTPSAATTRAGEAAVLEVWLTVRRSGRPGGRDCASGACRILAEDTVDGRAGQLARHGPGLALRFQLFAAGVVLLLAAGTVVVAVHSGATQPGSRSCAPCGPRVCRAGQVRWPDTPASPRWSGRPWSPASLAALVAQVAVTAALPVFADGLAAVACRPGWRLLPLLTAVVAGLVAPRCAPRRPGPGRSSSRYGGSRPHDRPAAGDDPGSPGPGGDRVPALRRGHRGRGGRTGRAANRGPGDRPRRRWPRPATPNGPCR